MKCALLAAVAIPRTAAQVAAILKTSPGAAAELCREYVRRGDVKIDGVVHSGGAGQPAKLYVAR